MSLPLPPSVLAASTAPCSALSTMRSVAAFPRRRPTNCRASVTTVPQVKTNDSRHRRYAWCARQREAMQHRAAVDKASAVSSSGLFARADTGACTEVTKCTRNPPGSQFLGGHGQPTFTIPRALSGDALASCCQTAEPRVSAPSPASAGMSWPHECHTCRRATTFDVNSPNHPRLTLTTCHPTCSAARTKVASCRGPREWGQPSRKTALRAGSGDAAGTTREANRPATGSAWCISSRTTRMEACGSPNFCRKATAVLRRPLGEPSCSNRDTPSRSSPSATDRMRRRIENSVRGKPLLGRNAGPRTHHSLEGKRRPSSKTITAALAR
mmetsp:Transcript_52494/g.162916  ORF Transcript_52494/g.162916 Transcript_52494/m.162916 type:complete len:326 (-) Transcript_52494:581-1558(-)